MHDVECPYCGAGVDICHDDGYGYEENKIHQDSCPKCGKEFAYTVSFSIDHEAYKADCLNGAECKWEPVKAHPAYWPNWRRCRDCGAEERGEVDRAAVEADHKRWQEYWEEKRAGKGEG